LLCSLVADLMVPALYQIGDLQQTS